jgi:hypothetical protein
VGDRFRTTWSKRGKVVAKRTFLVNVLLRNLRLLLPDGAKNSGKQVGIPGVSGPARRLLGRVVEVVFVTAEEPPRGREGTAMSF